MRNRLSNGYKSTFTPRLSTRKTVDLSPLPKTLIPPSLARPIKTLHDPLPSSTPIGR